MDSRTAFTFLTLKVVQVPSICTGGVYALVVLMKVERVVERLMLLIFSMIITLKFLPCAG